MCSTLPDPALARIVGELFAALQSVKPDGCEIRIILSPDQPAIHLTPVQRKTLNIVTEMPMPPKRIARLAGVAYNSWFRTALSHLIDAGLVVRVRGGIRKGK